MPRRETGVFLSCREEVRLALLSFLRKKTTSFRAWMNFAYIAISIMVSSATMQSIRQNYLGQENIFLKLFLMALQDFEAPSISPFSLALMSPFMAFLPSSTAFSNLCLSHPEPFDCATSSHLIASHRSRMLQPYLLSLPFL